jgi:tripartite-type tricarboxylate transporter receptor subunit TctC
MKPFKQCVLFLSAALALSVHAAVGAQEAFPSKPIHMFVPVSPGSQADILARIVGGKMFEGSGQAVVVENRPSGGGVAATQAVATAVPDGYSLLMAPAGLAVSVALYPSLPFNVRTDLVGVSQVSSGASVLIVDKKLGIKTVKELVDLAKAKPGQLNYSTTGMGGSAHINAEMFRMATGINITHIPYKGAPEAINALVAGHVQMFFSSIAAAITQIKDGRVVALGVTTKERSSELPDVPTMEQAGVPGYEFDQWFALLAPAKTPKPVLDRLSREVARVLALPDVSKQMTALGAVPKSSTPEQETAALSSEIDKFTKIVHDAGIKL